jgi:hypothetical protein
MAFLTGLFFATSAFAQVNANSPWENAVGVLQQAFTSTIARGLSLVAIVVSGLTFAFRAIKTNIGDSLNVVVHLERRPGLRFVSEVLEIHGYDPDRDEYNYGFIFNRHKEIE